MDMGKLQAALSWAARGFRVFPLQVNSKDPIDIQWTERATTDPDMIRHWWIDPVTGAERDNNIGCLTSDWIVPDIDTKKGRKGLATFAALGMEWDTLTVRTPSNGYHTYYRKLEGPTGQSPLGEGVDVRSHNGYVVAPGSTLDGVEYTVELDLPIAEFPEHLRPRLKPPKQRAAALASSVETDTPEQIEIGIHFLCNYAEHASEGARNYTCYKTACRLRDFGLSEYSALEAMVEHWNEFNSPPLDLEEVQHTVGSAYQRATGIHGGSSPQAGFGDIVPVAAQLPAIIAPPALNGVNYQFGNFIPVADIETRPWIMGDLLLSGAVTLLVAASKGGKSLLTLIVAAHLAVGKEFLGWKPVRPLRSILYNAEDDCKEVSRRLAAVCAVYELDLAAVSAMIAIEDVDHLGLVLTQNRPPTVNTDVVDRLVAAASSDDVGLVSLDPLIEIHTANENDPVEMKYVLSVMRSIARRAMCAVLAVHHTGKVVGGSNAYLIGNLNAGRGSSSVPAGARKVITLVGASKEDCIDLGAVTTNRGDYLRIDDGGGNYSRGMRGPRWMRWVDHRIDNGDNVGVLVSHDAGDSYDASMREVASILYNTMVNGSQASMDMAAAIDALRREGIAAKDDDARIVRNRIERVLAQPVNLGKGVVRLARENKTTKVVIG
jgi:AAA domain-containing protein/bifunctional DNA primase/polymerase-like protein/primase-like protein